MNKIDLGILEPLLQDSAVNEIMVNGYEKIFTERQGRIVRRPESFSSSSAYVALVERLAAAHGKVLSPESPYADLRLEDGSRVSIAMSPMAVDGPVLTIRRFSPQVFSLADLAKIGSLSAKATSFLELAVKARANIIISGPTSSGKTTFLNALAMGIPLEERIVTIEDTPELRLPHENWVRLEAVTSMRGDIVSVKDCLVSALRMRPDRIIVGECRRNETFEMLQAMSTGHSGSLTTVHASSARDCLSRLESLVLSSIEFPLGALRRQVASALDLIVQLRRDRSGERFIAEICEISGMEEDTILLQTIFQLDGFEQLEPTGMIPRFATEIQACGLKVPSDIFKRKAP